MHEAVAISRSSQPSATPNQAITTDVIGALNLANMLTR